MRIDNDEARNTLLFGPQACAHRDQSTRSPGVNGRKPIGINIQALPGAQRLERIALAILLTRNVAITSV